MIADQKATEDGHNEKQRALILEQVKEILIQRIESGVMPWIKEEPKAPHSARQFRMNARLVIQHFIVTQCQPKQARSSARLLLRSLK